MKRRLTARHPSSVIDTIPPMLRRMPRILLEKTTSLAVGKQMETIGRDLMRNVAAAYPDWRRTTPTSDPA